MTHNSAHPTRHHSEKDEQLFEKAKKNASHRAQARIGEVPDLEIFQRGESDAASYPLRTRLAKLGLDYILRNVPLGDALKNEHLAQIGGKVEFPFLVDHRTGTKLYGLATILTYLDTEYGEPPKTPILRIARRINNQVQSSAEQLTWAMKAPIDQLQRVRVDAREAVHVLEKSLKTLQKTWKESKA